MAGYLSSYGQQGKRGGHRPESGWGERARHDMSWPTLSKFWRGGGYGGKTVLIGPKVAS